IAGWAVPMSHYNLLVTVLLLRLVAVSGVVLIGISLPRLASARGRDPSQAFWLGVCNPLVLIHFIAGAHNDALMVGLTVAGLALLLSAVGVLYLLWRAPKLGTVRACALALALVVALGPVVLPWYALWAIVVIAAGGDEFERGYAIFASVVLLAVLEPSGSAMPDLMLMITVVALMGIAVALSCRPVRRWIRDQVPSVVERSR